MERKLPTKSLLVRVPATTANLGPGFDSLGLALGWFNAAEVRVDVEQGHEIEGEGADSLPRGPGNLFRRSLVTVAEWAGMELPSVSVRQENAIPLASGLGSSSATIIGACVAANILLDRPFTDDELFVIAAEIEGHPDNVAPALFGGLTVCYESGERPSCLRISPVDPPRAVIAIPDHQVETEMARRVLPDSVPRKDAVYNVGHAAAVVAAFASGEYAALAAAMDDRLHQPYRAHLVPGMEAALAAAKSAGALGSALSGSGPTIVAFAAEREEAVAAAMKGALSDAGVAAVTRTLEVCEQGATAEWRG